VPNLIEIAPFYLTRLKFRLATNRSKWRIPVAEGTRFSRR
jgi:hypothetical protein